MKENLGYPNISTLRSNRDLLQKRNVRPSGWESNPRPRESNAMFCQLSYGGRYREHGHEFSFKEVGMPIKWHNQHSHLLNIKPVAMFSATTSVAQLTEHRISSRSRFPAGRPKVAFSQQVPVGSQS